MKRLRTLLQSTLFIIPLLTTVACSTPFTAPENSNLKTDDYAPSSVADPAEITARKVFPEALTTKTIVINSRFNSPTQSLPKFLKDAFKALGFTEVMDVTEFQQKLVRDHIAEKIPAGTQFNIVGMGQIAKFAPPFLVVDSIGVADGPRCASSLDIYDPRGETLFSYKHSGVVWSDFNKECAYPMINAVRDWYQESVGGQRQKDKPKPVEPKGDGKPHYRMNM